METVLTFLLIRFAVIAAVVVVIALLLMAVVRVLRRKGKSEEAQKIASAAADFAMRQIGRSKR